MSIKATCTCGAWFEARPELAGKSVECISCGQAFVVPGPKLDDEPPGISNDSADSVGTAGPQTLPCAKHRQGKPEKSRRRRYILIGIGGAVVVVLLFVAGLALLHNPPVTIADDASVIAEIERLGGTLGRDESAPDKPVRSVGINGTVVTNNVLERLEGLPRGALSRRVRCLDERGWIE